MSVPGFALEALFTVLLEILSTGYPARLRFGVRFKTVGFYSHLHSPAELNWAFAPTQLLDTNGSNTTWVPTYTALPANARSININRIILCYNSSLNHLGSHPSVHDCTN